MGKVRLNTDAELVAAIREGLERTGGYCPCRREKKPEYKCMCEEFKTQITAADTAIVKSNGRSIALNEGLLINYYFKTTLTNIQSAELLTWRGVEGELTYENATKTELIFASGEYAAQGELVPAPFCGDTIYACARFVDANGVEYYTAVSAYSTHQYASNQLNKSTTSEADRNLLQALLVYSSLANAKFAK